MKIREQKCGKKIIWSAYPRGQLLYSNSFIIYYQGFPPPFSDFYKVGSDKDIYYLPLSSKL